MHDAMETTEPIPLATMRYTDRGGELEGDLGYTIGVAPALKACR